MNLDELTPLIRKYALANALKYDGKANPGAVIGGVIGEHPELKSSIKVISVAAKDTCDQISTLSLDAIRAELESNHPEMLEEKKKEEKDDLKSFKKIPEKGVIMRFAPSPSGPMHIGHAITGGLTSLYVKKYGGTFILRIEDTNSDNIDPAAYDMLVQDAAWIFGNVTDVWIQSDRMDTYYQYAQKFIDNGNCYVCTCSQESFKKLVDAMEACPCRELAVTEHQQRWRKMFDKEQGYKEGEAVLRFKSDITHNNPAMRDFPLARINDSPHPRQKEKYRVWPLMNMSVFVDDIEAGMTHIIRAKDHEVNSKRQELMYKALGRGDEFPETYFTGRYNFEGIELSASKTKARIKAGEFNGWDDIRIPFLQALKRRGYQPEAFMKYTRLVGVSPVDKSVAAEEFFKSINTFNKEIIDKKAKRFFFMHDYEKIIIHKAPHQQLHLRLHPDQDDFGQRALEVEQEFLIRRSDLGELKEGELYRFMDCLNFVKRGPLFEFDSLEFEKYCAHGKKIMHFLPAYGNIDTEILMDDGTIIKGVAEHNISQLKIGDIIQFERFGFCRLDAIEHHNSKSLYKFWFTHK